jgi:glycosyltransferase involved in cell wall biosynthesis
LGKCKIKIEQAWDLFRENFRKRKKKFLKKELKVEFMKAWKFWKMHEWSDTVKFIIFHPMRLYKKYSIQATFLIGEALRSYKREGFYKVARRTWNYIQIGEGVLHKADVRQIGEGALYEADVRQEISGVDLLNEEMRLLPPKAKKILVIDRFFPMHDKDSGSLRMFNILKILRDSDYEVTFFPEDSRGGGQYAADLESMKIEIVSENLEQYLKGNGTEYSLVVLSRPDQAFAFLPLVLTYAINAKIFYDTVDLHWVRMERGSKISKDLELPGQAEEYKKKEILNALSSDVVLTITPEEKKTLEAEIPGKEICILPNIHEIHEKGNSFKVRSDIMFIGGFLHKPNIDAILYFVKEIFPEIKKKIPALKFYVVGSEPSKEIKELSSFDVIVTGYVKDVDPYFLKSRVFVSPLRYGAGMKGKIGHAMSFGLPVVTTSIGAEGMRLKNEENAIIADNLNDFATAVVRLYEDEKLWYKLSNNSIHHIKENFSADAVKKIIAEIFK